MDANDAQRYVVRIEVFAAAGHLDLERETPDGDGGEMASVIAQLQSADPDDVEDRTYRQLRFDLCDGCRRGLLADPLGQTEGSVEEES